MKGTVEIYSSYGTPKEELIFWEDNLVVDKAGETFVDLLTTNPSISSIPSASAILDTSNYTIQAISFATDPSAYHRNMHDSTDTNKTTAVGGTSPFVRATLIGYVSATDTSSYIPIGTLIDPPSPLDYKLVENIQALATIRDLGQNPNFIQFSGVPVANRIQGYPEGTSTSRLFGAYAPREGILYSLYTGHSNGFGNLTQVFPGTSGTTAASYGRYAHGYNECSAIDYRGYITAYQASGDGSDIEIAENSKESNFTSGLLVSSLPNYFMTGKVIHATTITSADLGVANLYGGIYTMGLWNLDLSASLANGKTPPYSWINASGITDREYRLFSKKVFTKNLCYIRDVQSMVGASQVQAGCDNYQSLTIVWNLKFLPDNMPES